METFIDPVEGTTWEIDVDFLSTRWTCIWDRGCEGILEERARELGQGCCSFGAGMLDAEEGRRIVALAATLDASIFEQVGAAEDGVLDDTGRQTRVVDGACVFLNRPGFGGGAGCALHLGAIADGESPTDWKPAVCWQLPLKVDRPDHGGAVLRRWSRRDWGPEGQAMAWCCTEEPETLVGDTPLVVSMAEEIEALVGPDVAVAIRRRIVGPLTESARD